MRRRHKILDTLKFVTSEWNHIKVDLHRERGLWYEHIPAGLDKWMLDTIEGPSRMRRRLKPNATFYEDYPYEPAFDTAESADLHVRLVTKVAVFFVVLNICINYITFIHIYIPF